LASHAILNAPTSDSDRAIATMVTAFSSDPFVRWMLPEPNQYLTYFAAAVRLFAGAAFEAGSAFRSADFMAVALWLPPGVHSDAEPLGVLMQTAIHEDVQADAFAVLEQMGMSHPEEDHWYLPMIGVDPARQGMGYGSALLDTSLASCDEAHLPAYLESTSPRNIPLYERYGFKLTGEIQIGGSPPIWPMLREAR
jgi:ribosomal protein S18 acetylase RimI-like enzyme